MSLRTIPQHSSSHHHCQTHQADVNAIHDAEILHMTAKKSEVDSDYTPVTNSHVMTDNDSFPYTRAWRGIHDSEEPIFWGRRAGWRPQQVQAYNKTDCGYTTVSPRTDYCWQIPCSTVLPCHRKNYLCDSYDRNLLINTIPLNEYR